MAWRGSVATPICLRMRQLEKPDGEVASMGGLFQLGTACFNLKRPGQA